MKISGTISTLLFMGGVSFSLGTKHCLENNQEEREEEILDSLIEKEKELHQSVQQRSNEQAWIYDGDVWYNLCSNATEYSCSMNVDEIVQLLEQAEQRTIYFYSSHNKGMTQGYEGLNPPSENHLILHAILEKEYPETTLVSRLLDPYGVWEYDTTQREDCPGLEFYNNMFAFLDDTNPYHPLRGQLQEKLPTLADKPIPTQVAAILPLYQALGVTVTFQAME